MKWTKKKAKKQTIIHIVPEHRWYYGQLRITGQRMSLIEQ